MGANLVVTAAIGAGRIAVGVDKAIAAKPESLLVIGDANTAAGAVRDARAKGFRGPMYGFSNAGESLLAEELGPTGAGVVVARVVPKSDTVKVPVVNDMLTDLKDAKLGKPNVYMLEGYIAARVFAEALRKIPKDPTRAKLKKAIASMEDTSVGGFRINFGENERTGSKLVQLSLIDSQGKVRE